MYLSALHTCKKAQDTTEIFANSYIENIGPCRFQTWKPEDNADSDHRNALDGQKHQLASYSSI
jgi:hypothetical protein